MLYTLGKKRADYAALLQDDILSCGLLQKLVGLLDQQDKSVKLQSCRLLAGYAAGTGQLQRAISTTDTLQVGQHMPMLNAPVKTMLVSE